ncbi:Fc.00g074370.m01.CDS01 [Cosmosporella sp. VM-42]
MKTSTILAGGVLSLASLAAAIPACAIECFQAVITDHPPLECQEADMYHCFCKDPFGPDLQRYYLECARSDCGSPTDANDAIQFGVDLCSELGFPITIPIDEPTSPTTTSKPAETTSVPAKTTSEPAETTTEPSATESESASIPAETEESTSEVATASATASGSGSATASEPAGETTTAATASGSVSDSVNTVNTKIPATTTVCTESEEPVATSVQPSGPWECHGCNSTATRVSSLTTVTQVHTVECPSCTEKPTGHNSDNTHPTVSQGAAKPSGTDVVVPTKSTGAQESGSESTPATATPTTVEVNMGNSASVSSFLAAAGLAVAVFRLL